MNQADNISQGPAYPIERRALGSTGQLLSVVGFGGIIVMKAENMDMVQSIFDRFRKSVERHPFPQTGRITVSIGIVEITGDESPSVFVGCADKALYYAKEHGKNMACVYSDLVERKLIQPQVIRKGKVVIFDQ